MTVNLPADRPKNPPSNQPADKAPDQSTQPNQPADKAPDQSNQPNQPAEPAEHHEGDGDRHAHKLRLSDLEAPIATIALVFAYQNRRARGALAGLAADMGLIDPEITDDRGQPEGLGELHALLATVPNWRD